MITSPARARDVGCVVLAAVSGATDAIGFLALGGAFTSVMTGNMVLVGIAIGRGNTETLSHAGIAIVAYMVGCGVGARLGGVVGGRDDESAWPGGVTRVLWFETAAFVVVALVWWSDGSHPGGAVATTLLAVGAVALGAQSSAIARFGVSGLSTTYMTGTLTTMVIRLAQTGHVRGAVPNVRLLVGLIGGAALGALVVTRAESATPVLQLVGMAAVLVLGLTAARTHEAAPTDSAVQA